MDIIRPLWGFHEEWGDPLNPAFIPPELVPGGQRRLFPKDI